MLRYQQVLQVECKTSSNNLIRREAKPYPKRMILWASLSMWFSGKQIFFFPIHNHGFITTYDCYVLTLSQFLMSTRWGTAETDPASALQCFFFFCCENVHWFFLLFQWVSYTVHGIHKLLFLTKLLLKISLTALFTHLKIILLQYFQFSAK